MPHRLPVSKTSNLGNLRATILYYTVIMTAARNSLGKSSGLYITVPGARKMPSSRQTVRGGVVQGTESIALVYELEEMGVANT